MKLYTLRNGSGLSLTLSDFGARIISIKLPVGESGTEVCLRYPNDGDYLSDTVYLGATIGPIANRLAEGSVNIEGQRFQIPANEGNNTLHGGENSFDKQTWNCVEQTDNSVTFVLSFTATSFAIPKKLLAPLPGQMEIQARYEIEGSRLIVEYSANSDQATYLNLTNHVYLNLGGTSGTIRDHRFRLYSGNFLEKDAVGIPTGNLVSVPNPFDYELNRITEWGELDGQVDHHFVVDEHDSSQKAMAEISSPSTGISLLVSSTKPGFQFYTAQYLSSPFKPFAGFCIEPQYAPNAINMPDFLSPLTTPRVPYQHNIVYDFSW